MKMESWSDQVWDLVVWGGGYAGLGAALSSRALGQSVLWIDSLGVLLPETSWGFCRREGPCDDPLYQEWARTLTSKTPHMRLGGEGAIGEIAAHRVCQDRGIHLLFYVWLESAQGDGEQVSSVTVVSKAGRHQIHSHRWVDATENHELVTLLQNQCQSKPLHRNSYLFFRRESWGSGAILEKPFLTDEGCTVAEVEAGWTNERAFSLSENLPKTQSHRSSWIRALPQIRDALGSFSKGAVVSHLSFIPVQKYAPVLFPSEFPTNVAAASSLLDLSPSENCPARFESGVRATRHLFSLPRPDLKKTNLERMYRKPQQSLAGEVCVAGLGTAGALAALASSRQGAQVYAFDTLPFPGGIGTAGGIHLYYFGVPGGLQNEVDQRIREVQPLFGSQDQIAGFHPVAKAAVLESMLETAGVKTLYRCFLNRSDYQSRALKKISVLDRSSETCITAQAWIDSTGDGDLCAMTGATYQQSSRKDGLSLAYTQSSGRFRYKNERLFHRIVNYDSGFVDSLSPQDLTRARVAGVLQHEQENYSLEERPTYLAPALGIRQGRHVATITTLQLRDLLEKRKFPDLIGLTGCHYDSHHTDAQFEDEEVVFWVWACRNWKERTAAEIPYGVIVPLDLDNVWVACRASGCTPDAHHSMRMQRDMQRLGEAAGIAASLAIRHRCHNQDVPILELQKLLRLSGALQQSGPSDSPFGYVSNAGGENKTPPSGSELLTKLASVYGPTMYQIYLRRDELYPAIAENVRSPEPSMSWKCACILAMWSDVKSVPRLLQAIENREYGFTPQEESEGRSPAKSLRFAPNWLVALVLVRRCPDRRVLPILEKLSHDSFLNLEARTSVLLTLAELARHDETHAETCTVLPRCVAKLLETDPPGRWASPQRYPSGESPSAANLDGIWYPKVREDFIWQLHWAAAWALIAAGLPYQPDAKRFLTDSRGPVRNAFAKLLIT